MLRLRSLSVAVAVGAVASAACVVPASAAPPTPVRTPVTSFSFVSDPGDYVGQGASLSLVAPAATISVSGDVHTVSLDASAGGQYFTANLAAGAGDTLHPGLYTGAERTPFRTGRSPGIDVYGDSRGCNTDAGSFAVNQIAFDANGALTMADIDFVQHCEGAAPALTGSIEFNARPLSYSQQSDRGDYIGAGATRTYTGARSLIQLTGSASQLFMSVSGLGDDWSGEFGAPSGKNFVVGKTYATSRFGDATHAALDVNGDGRGCNQSSGTLTVRRLVLAQGAVSQALVTFTQHCEGGKPALHGTLHYYA